jgi:peptidoglycan/xylan/chitin deacetylase (PgdA/CDA1 family)
MNEAAYRIEAELGISVASDTRGTQPFLPVDHSGRAIGPVQLPTTLPTLDELIGLDGRTAGNVHDALLRLTEKSDAPSQVYTLHAELEGQKLMPTFERLLAGWRAQGHRFASLSQLAEQLDAKALPRCRPQGGEVPGRSGSLAVQGASVAMAGSG